MGNKCCCCNSKMPPTLEVGPRLGKTPQKVAKEMKKNKKKLKEQVKKG